MGYENVRCGSVTFAQRFGSALNLNPHAHSLLLDGVYTVGQGDDIPAFVPAPRLDCIRLQTPYTRQTEA
jgi:hypothetical protein